MIPLAPLMAGDDGRIPPPRLILYNTRVIYSGIPLIMSTQAELDKAISSEYEAGFATLVESDTLPPGLNEDVIRVISAKKGEPEWLLEWRLEAYRHWQTMQEPDWAHVSYPPVDLNAISYYSAPKSMEDRPQSLDEVDPELLDTYKKLGIPLHEREKLAGVAVEAGERREDDEVAECRPLRRRRLGIPARPRLDRRRLRGQRRSRRRALSTRTRSTRRRLPLNLSRTASRAYRLASSTRAVRASRQYQKALTLPALAQWI